MNSYALPFLTIKVYPYLSYLSHLHRPSMFSDLYIYHTVIPTWFHHTCAAWILFLQHSVYFVTPHTSSAISMLHFHTSRSALHCELLSSLFYHLFLLVLTAFSPPLIEFPAYVLLSISLSAFPSLVPSRFIFINMYHLNNVHWFYSTLTTFIFKNQRVYKFGK